MKGGVQSRWAWLGVLSSRTALGQQTQAFVVQRWSDKRGLLGGHQTGPVNVGFEHGSVFVAQGKLNAAVLTVLKPALSSHRRSGPSGGREHLQ